MSCCFILSPKFTTVYLMTYLAESELHWFYSTVASILQSVLLYEFHIVSWLQHGGGGYKVI